eukprot:scaffold3262_cov109-Isochrysis_galbana.AAC.3
MPACGASLSSGPLARVFDAAQTRQAVAACGNHVAVLGRGCSDSPADQMAAGVNARRGRPLR